MHKPRSRAAASSSSDQALDARAHRREKRARLDDEQRHKNNRKRVAEELERVAVKKKARKFVKEVLRDRSTAELSKTPDAAQAEVRPRAEQTDARLRIGEACIYKLEAMVPQLQNIMMRLRKIGAQDFKKNLEADDFVLDVENNDEKQPVDTCLEFFGVMTQKSYDSLLTQVSVVFGLCKHELILWKNFVRNRKRALAAANGLRIDAKGTLPKFPQIFLQLSASWKAVGIKYLLPRNKLPGKRTCYRYYSTWMKGRTFHMPNWSHKGHSRSVPPRCNPVTA